MSLRVATRKLPPRVGLPSLVLRQVPPGRGAALRAQRSARRLRGLPPPARPGAGAAPLPPVAEASPGTGGAHPHAGVADPAAPARAAPAELRGGGRRRERGGGRWVPLGRGGGASSPPGSGHSSAAAAERSEWGGGGCGSLTGASALARVSSRGRRGGCGPLPPCGVGAACGRCGPR